MVCHQLRSFGFKVRHSGSRLSAERLGLVALGLALTVSATACGQGVSSDPAATASDTGAQLVSLQEQVSGTSVERSASSFLLNYAVDGGMQECMATLGMPLPIRFLDETIGMKTLSPGESWAFPLRDKSAIWDLQVQAEKYPQYQEASAVPPKGAIENTDAFSKALVTCDKRIEEPSPESVEPKDRDGLAYELFKLVTSTEARFGEVRVYDRCMADAGYDTVVEAEDFSGIGGLYQLFWAQRPPWREIPEVGAEGGKVWDRYLMWADGVLEADVGCREEKHHEVMAALAPLLDDFEEQNAQALAQVDAEWDEIILRAQAVGWTDETQRYTTASTP